MSKVAKTKTKTRAKARKAAVPRAARYDPCVAHALMVYAARLGTDAAGRPADDGGAKALHGLQGLPMAIERRADHVAACVKHEAWWICRPTLSLADAERRLGCLRRQLWFSRSARIPAILREWGTGRTC